MIELRQKEIYRFLGYQKITPSPEVDEWIKECVEKMQKAATPRCFYKSFPVRQTAPDITEIAGLSIKSKNLYKNLEGCDHAYMFAATVGIGIDMLIKRSELTSLMEASIYQAAGAEMVESFADSEVKIIRESEAASGYTLRPRFSPGYGDLPLALQSDFARILDMQKWCGITLTETLLMVPSKSITAFIGCTKKTESGNDGDYLAKVINPLEATGLSAGEASGVPDNPECKTVGPDMIESEVDNKIRHNPDETSCTLCSKAKDCLYRK